MGGHRSTWHDVGLGSNQLLGYLVGAANQLLRSTLLSAGVRKSGRGYPTTGTSDGAANDGGGASSDLGALPCHFRAGWPKHDPLCGSGRAVPGHVLTNQA
ncbi:hypothetical protein GUJ93_ZPchr0001g29841 [Zizania palustris]|uniref:Uncharacterized protein n=1 Tax=Zizania palustris TaxID=103762 RepID=A0A8J5RPC0_ZIZPA|nr:hypothetical protein GUJ93_ZPchr0001g29841 [Zizania palustris]